MRLIMAENYTNRTEIHSALRQKGIKVWTWPDDGALPNSRGEISIFRIHIEIPGQKEIISPEPYHGKVAVGKAVIRITDALWEKYCC